MTNVLDGFSQVCVQAPDFVANRTRQDVPLLTAKITTFQCRQQVKDICEIWKRQSFEASQKAHVSAVPIEASKKDRAIDSFVVMSSLCSSLIDRENRSSLYVAFDTCMKLQAVALAQLMPNEGLIEYLGSNPENLDILGTEQNMVRGGATAVIRHIARDVLSQRIDDDAIVSLDALLSAIPFYSKVGFSSGLYSQSMFLEKRGMESLLHIAPYSHQMCECEPERVIL